MGDFRLVGPVERGKMSLAPRFFHRLIMDRWLSATRNVFWVASGHEPNDCNSAFIPHRRTTATIVMFTMTDSRTGLKRPSGKQLYAVGYD